MARELLERLSDACTAALDPIVSPHGFLRVGRSPKYLRKSRASTKQTLTLNARRSRHADDGAIVFVEARTNVRMADVGAIADELASVQPRLLPGRRDVVFGMGLEGFNPTRDWLDFRCDDVRKVSQVCRDIGVRFVGAAIPFLHRLMEPVDLVRLYEEGSPYLSRHPEDIIRICAAYLLCDRKAEAASVFRKEASRKPEWLTMYGYENVAEELERRAAVH